MGNIFEITFRYANSAASALTLNVNNTGAKPIFLNGSASSATNHTLPAGKYIVFYDGTNYCINTTKFAPINISGAAACAAFATFATIAGEASTAWNAIHASSAAYAAYALSAGTSTSSAHATHAGSATFATSAGNATHAASATYASSASFAAAANTAGSTLLAAKANAANVASTTNAVAYYTDAGGTFGSKASADGALYATAADGALNWGTLPIAQGGTGATTTTAARVNLQAAPVKQSVFYGLCNTPAATLAKEVILIHGEGYVEEVGTIVVVDFVYGPATASGSAPMTMKVGQNGTARNLLVYGNYIMN